MSYLIILSLVVVLVWLIRRHWFLVRGVGMMEEAVRLRRPFLSDDDRLARAHRSWRSLASTLTNVVKEAGRLNEQRVGQLTQLETTLGCLKEAVLVMDKNNYNRLKNNALQTIFPSAK